MGGRNGDIPRLFGTRFALSHFDLRQALFFAHLGRMPKELQPAREPLREEDIQGLKYFRQLWPLFERLHDVGCQRDKARNRKLHMDQYCALDCIRDCIRGQPFSMWSILQASITDAGERCQNGQGRGRDLLDESVGSSASARWGAVSLRDTLGSACWASR